MSKYKRRLAFHRRLVRQVLASLKAVNQDESKDFQRGWDAAAEVVRSTLTFESPPSKRKETLDQAAAFLGIEPDGMGSGHLTRIWETAYAEGQQNPSLRLLLRLLRNAGL